MDTQVIIVGAGPVGLTLAIDLGLRGVRCILLERKSEPQFLPKMERCNARSMEMFRRIGLADELRSAGLTTDAIMDVSNRGGIVLDCFLGSGTTLLAAEHTGRVFRGIELDPGYVDTAIRRWQIATGKDAVREDGQTFSHLEREHEQS